MGKISATELINVYNYINNIKSTDLRIIEFPLKIEDFDLNQSVIKLKIIRNINLTFVGYSIDLKFFLINKKNDEKIIYPFKNFFMEEPIIDINEGKIIKYILNRMYNDVISIIKSEYTCNLYVNGFRYKSILNSVIEEIFKLVLYSFYNIPSFDLYKVIYFIYKTYEEDVDLKITFDSYFDVVFTFLNDNLHSESYDIRPILNFKSISSILILFENLKSYKNINKILNVFTFKKRLNHENRFVVESLF